MKIIGFIPCRAGSERVKHKNTREFAGYAHGLLELKLRQMQKVEGLDKIIVSSNDSLVLDYATRFAAEHDPRVTPLPRPEKWGNSATSMGEFIADYIAHMEDEGHIFWTHVTHPFATAAVYSRALDAYRARLAEGYDSLISATKLQKFLWRDGKPFNYDNSVERWPRSQDLEPVYEINHAIYAMPFALMRETRDRIGHKPFFFEMEEGESMDIDWEDQFRLMDEIARARRQNGQSLE